MKKVINALRNIGSVAGLLLALCLSTGCQTSGSRNIDTQASIAGGDVSGSFTNLASEVFKPGDTVNISFADLPTPTPAQDVRVDDGGEITLLYSQKFKAAGKTRQQLQEEIRERYVPKYFKYLTVNIHAILQFYFVGGEVRQPNRYEYVGKMTVLKAIQTAGDFTDFAKKTKVTLYRSNGQSLRINATKALKDPSLDVEVLPGDRINVPRRIF